MVEVVRGYEEGEVGGDLGANWSPSRSMNLLAFSHAREDHESAPRDSLRVQPILLVSDSFSLWDSISVCLSVHIVSRTDVSFFPSFSPRPFLSLLFLFLIRRSPTEAANKRYQAFRPPSNRAPAHLPQKYRRPWVVDMTHYARYAAEINRESLNRAETSKRDHKKFHFNMYQTQRHNN